MRKIILLAGLCIAFTSCSSDDDGAATVPPVAGLVCTGASCAGTVGTGETAATVPDTATGVFMTRYTNESAGSIFTDGTTAAFEVRADQTLVVDVDGFECITISNPVWRFGADATSGNYTFQDECRDMISYNVSYNTDGSFAEVNIEPASGAGFFGQFKLVP